MMHGGNLKLILLCSW